MVIRFSWMLLAIAIPFALTLHFLPGSTYNSPESMDTYFGYENSPGSWRWEHGPLGSWEKEWEPFKYRIVFRGLVDSLAHLFLLFGAERDLQTYWVAFLTVSVLSYSFAIWGCDRFLQAVGLETQGRLIGVTAWLVIPPIVFAYMLPVQTKEDFLAYGLFFLALRGMLRESWVPVVVICLIGAFVRETLLIVSLIVLLGTSAPRYVKAATIALPIAAHIGLRLTFGMDGYQVFRESNLFSATLPILSLLLVFGYGWLPLALYMARANLVAPIWRGLSMLKPSLAPQLSTQDQRLEALRNTFPYMILLLIMSHFFMGRIQEIRISCLLSPFVLLALVDMFKGRIWTRRALIVGLTGTVGTVIIVVLLEYSEVVTPFRQQFNLLVGDFAHHRWWAMAYLHLILAVGLFATYTSMGLEVRSSNPEPRRF